MKWYRDRAFWVMCWFRNWKEDFDYFLKNWLVLATYEEKEIYWPAILEYFKLNNVSQCFTLDWEEKEIKEKLKWHLQYKYWIFIEWINFETFNTKIYKEFYRTNVIYKLSEKSSFKIWWIGNSEVIFNFLKNNI